MALDIKDSVLEFLNENTSECDIIETSDDSEWIDPFDNNWDISRICLRVLKSLQKKGVVEPLTAVFNGNGVWKLNQSRFTKYGKDVDISTFNSILVRVIKFDSPLIQELFNNADNARLAHDRMAGTTKKYVSVPGTHYAVYREQRAAVVTLAIAWFDEHLRK